MPGRFRDTSVCVIELRIVLPSFLACKVLHDSLQGLSYPCTFVRADKTRHCEVKSSGFFYEFLASSPASPCSLLYMLYAYARARAH